MKTKLPKLMLLVLPFSVFSSLVATHGEVDPGVFAIHALAWGGFTLSTLVVARFLVRKAAQHGRGGVSRNSDG